MFTQHVLGKALLALTALAGAGNAFPSLREAAVAADPPPTNASLPVKSLGQLQLNKPGFAAILPQDGKDSLFVSSFQAFGNDAVYRLDGVSGISKTGISKLQSTKVGGSVTWPNDITEAPTDVFGSDGIVVGGGFLVPGKGNGGVYFSPTSGGKSGDFVKLMGKSGWFYHRVVFADIDGDGKKEMITCRAVKPTFGAAGTMLVYGKPTDPSKPQGPWTETEIGPGCDALFSVADLNGDGIPEVLAASYFTSQLNLYSSTAKTGFANAKDVKTTLLDGSIGAAFDVKVTDLNGDGKTDLLVTNHQGGNGNPSGSVYAYEVPADITNAKAYTRHTLASGFPVTQGGLNQASPGSPIAFRPTPNSKSGPQHIALAGDAAQIAYVLVPGSLPWQYTTTTLHNCGCTVGSLAVADVDGDGYSEVVVPCYDSNYLAAYSFAP